MDVAIVKYNAGNICSVVNAMHRLGVEPLVTDDPEKLMSADRVIFPGQGEASSTMTYLRERGLDEVIRSLRQPVLGICIGMQLMSRHSEEGDTECLGIFDAEVKRFRPQCHEDKVPHMGWNTLTNTHSALFKGFEKDEFVYFVHSYFADCESRFVSAFSEYDIDFPASVEYENVFGCQFHPEKSGKAGLKILDNFCKAGFGL